MQIDHSDQNHASLFDYIIHVWHVPSVYVACEGLSDLGHGRNQPTATIIGQYSASCHHGTLILTQVVARIDPFDQNLAYCVLTTHH